MGRYIVRPEFSAVASLADVRLQSSTRSAQLQSIYATRHEERAASNLDKWLIDSAGTVKQLSKGFAEMSTLGTEVLEMSEGEAARLDQELENVLVIKDRPLHLINPVKATQTRQSLGASDTWHLGAIGLSKARAMGFTGTGAGVAVAVLDTGVDSSHAEFAGKSVDMVSFDVDNWATQTAQTSLDTDGHGTHVAGLIAGKTVGVAPQATIVNGLMIPGGQGLLSAFVLAMEWVASRPDIFILNMSAGIPGFVAGMEDVIGDLLGVGVLPVIAVGNEGRNRTRSPGNYNPVLSVGASNKHDAVASFSGSGTLSVESQLYRVPDLVAPGEEVTSCVAGGGYAAWNGTSMAAPVVSGVAALILQRHPSIPVLELMSILIDTCKDLGIAADRQGGGVIQVTAANTDLANISGTGAGASRPLI